VRYLALALVFAAGPASADCAITGVAPRVLTAKDAVIPSDGGILVAAESVSRGSLDKGDVAVQKGWRVHIGNDTLKPPIDSLAPGLAVYRVSSPNAYKIDLEDDQKQVLVSIKPAKGSADKLAAPKVKKVTYDAKSPDYHGYEQILVDLDGGVPAGMVAMILADEHGKAKSFGLVAGSQVHPYEHHACDTLPNGTVPSKKGDKVVLMWVDESGRVSAATAAFTIGS